VNFLILTKRGPHSGWSKCDKYILCLTKIQFWDAYNFWSTPLKSILTADSGQARQKYLEHQFADLHLVQKWRYGLPNTFQNKHGDPWGQEWVVTLTVWKAIKPKPLGIFDLKLGNFSLLPQGRIWCKFEQIWGGAHGSTSFSLVGMEWPMKFHCSCATCKYRFFSEIFCVDSFSPKTNKFNPVPVYFSKLSK